MKKSKTTADPLLEVPVHLEEVLNTLRNLQKRLDVEMNAGLAGAKGAGVNPTHVRLAMQLSTATSQLSRETRAWTKRIKEISGSATLEERLGAVRMFLSSLSSETRDTFIRELKDD